MGNDSKKDKSEMGIRGMFRSFAQCTASAVGSPWAFILATLLIVIWAVSGPLFKFSDTWQLVINTSTTIVTFLMVFLIQNTQNRDARAMHLKLDELIRSVKGARNRLVDLEQLNDDELDHLQREFQQLRERTSKHPHAAEAIEETQEDLSEEQESRSRKRSDDEKKSNWRKGKDHDVKSSST